MDKPRRSDGRVWWASAPRLLTIVVLAALCSIAPDCARAALPSGDWFFPPPIPTELVYLHALLQELPGKLARLPQHRSLFEVSVHGCRVVAADTSGRLYLSLDYGTHWVETGAPWNGSVAAFAWVSSSARTAAKKDLPASEPVWTQTAVLRATLSDGNQWTSFDGFVWSPDVELQAP